MLVVVLALVLSITIHIHQSINQGPEVAHSTLWNVTKEKHRPKASSFKIPDDFDEQLEKQIYGPSTQIAQNTVRS